MRPEPRYQKGEEIGGRYQVHQVKMGGMGEVYLCLDLEKTHPYALKTFQSRYWTELQKLRVAFEQEVTTWIALEGHPNVVRCYWMQLLDNLPFMGLEWIAGEEGEGADLHSRLRHGPLNLKTALIYIIDICQGLLHAQQKRPGIVHRDLKPENILIAQGGLAKITDFGLAQIVEQAGLEPFLDAPQEEEGKAVPAGGQSLVWQRNIAGTPPYMAPEQWRGEELDARTDIYAVGCILYETLVGKRPFKAATLQEFRQQHLKATIPNLPDNLPQTLNNLLSQCLAKQQEDRPSDVTELLTALTRLYQEEFAELPPVRVTTNNLTAADYSNRAITYYILRQYESALADCRKAIELDPSFAIAYSNRGLINQTLQQYDQVLADFRQAIELDPNNAKNYTNRGIAYVKMQQYELALADFGRAIMLVPGSSKAHYNRGITYAELHQYELALADYKRAIELDPKDARIYYNRGNIFTELEQYELALADYERTIELDPSLALAYVNLGVLHGDQGRLDDALFCFEKAAELGDPTGARYAAEARQLLEQGDTPQVDPGELAIEAFLQVGSLREMRETVTQFPFMIAVDFIKTLQQVLTQRVPLEYRSYLEQRLTWLHQIADEKKPEEQD